MTDEDLHIFRTIAMTGNLSRAAVLLQTSQPTISRHLQHLEKELGTTLMDRSSGSIQLTPQGLQVLEFAQRVLGEWDALKQSFHQQQPISGFIEVASSTVPAKILVLPAVASFLRQYPHIHVHVSIMNSQNVFHAIDEDHVAMGFVGLEPPSQSWRTELIGRDEVILVVPNLPQYERWPTSIPLKDLAQLPFVQRKEGSGTHLTAIKALRERGFEQNWRVVCEVDSHEALIETVATGIGVGFASRQIAAMMSTRQVRMVSVEGGPILRHLYLIHKQDAENNKISDLFLSHLKTQHNILTRP
ncbi:LysR family transcriptional regulator [Sulfobacillus thermosulfidooxidans]|uniref:LysR family transcriptional regulator n=1 Tax=Sulfobacillus thermosulfidooxidans TaxID=28034 RepID=UPI0002DBE4F2|nr:LysR family transcriptional regulator [Sulfobacillus thermosulfidooxidans]